MQRLKIRELTYQQALNLLEAGMFTHIQYSSQSAHDWFVYREGNICYKNGSIRGSATYFLTQWPNLRGTWRVFNMV